MARIDRAEKAARLTGIVPAAAASAMALRGLAAARQQPVGRTTGTPYRRIPLIVYLVAGSIYTGLSVKGWRPVPVRLPTWARCLCTVAGLSLYSAGMGFVFSGRLALGRMYNLSSATGAELFANHQLVTTGPFRWVRHPMYFGALLAGAGALLLYRTWTMVFICLHLPVFCIRARREEEVLEQEFGDEWRKYRAQVPAGVPGLP